MMPKRLRWVHSGPDDFLSATVRVPVKTGNRLELFRAGAWRDWGDDRLHRWVVQRRGYAEPLRSGDAWTRRDAQKAAEKALNEVVEEVVRVANL